MKLSKEQAEAAFEALSAPARAEREKLEARLELRKRRFMPLRWSLTAVLAGLSFGGITYQILSYWFTGSWPIWAVTISLLASINIAQVAWNRRVKA